MLFGPSYNKIRYIHANEQNIPEEYKKYSLHIALERADSNYDWDSFKKILKLEPELLKMHLDNTCDILDYNYINLSEQQKEDLFDIQA